MIDQSDANSGLAWSTDVECVIFGASSVMMRSGLKIREMAEILFLVLDCSTSLFHSFNTLDDFGSPW